MAESCFLIIGLLILELRFWPTRKWSQAPQGNFFGRIALKREPWQKYHIHYMFSDLEEIWYQFDDMNVNHFKYKVTLVYEVYFFCKHVYVIL